MRLKSIKTSNILSFDKIENFDSAPNTIDFNSDLNILIGSNGSGKSNLLEIINKLFQTHFFDSYYINDNAFYSTNPNEKAILPNNDRKNSIQNTLFKNFNNREAESYLEVQIAMDKGDGENLLFLLGNYEELRTLSLKYCDNQSFFSKKYSINSCTLNSITPINIKFKVESERNSNRLQFVLQSSFAFPEHELFYNYLVYFNQLQTLIEVSNQYNKNDWPLLKNSFALISSMRTYGGFVDSFSVGVGLNDQVKQANQSEANQSAKNYVNTDYIFRITTIRLGQLFRKLDYSQGKEEVIRRLNNDDETVLKNINLLVSEHLGLSIVVEDFNHGNDTVKMKIYKGQEIVNFTELSMGQKSIFYLLFSVYGYDIKDGLLIIDEPELHLHLSMQRKYFDIVKSVCSLANIQVIIATHSSAFVNESTIKNTYRFFNEKNRTSIINPLKITQSQKDLIKILTYTNSSRIFFSDHVLLVEGDSDEYFFNYFYENYVRENIKTNKSIEIIYIGGKGNFLKWREFLNLFKISAYFIGDFDNIKEHGVVSRLGIDIKDLIQKSKDTVLKKLKDKIKDNGSTDGKELLRQLDSIVQKDFEMDSVEKEQLKSLWIYLIERHGIKQSVLVDYLKQTNTNGIHDKIITEIDKLYLENIFILKLGDLEDYLKISKDLSNVITFCQTQFADWILLKDERFLEIDRIFKTLLTEQVE